MLLLGIVTEISKNLYTTDYFEHSCDENYIIIGSDNGTMYMWNLMDGTSQTFSRLSRLETNSKFSSIAISPSTTLSTAIFAPRALMERLYGNQYHSSKLIVASHTGIVQVIETSVTIK